MVKRLLLNRYHLIALLSSLLCSYLSLFGSNIKDDVPLPVIVNQESVQEETDIRSQIIPFVIVYSQNELLITFFEQIGELSIYAINNTTGEVWTDEISSLDCFGSMSLATSHPYGSYQLRLIDGNDEIYSGYFKYYN